MVVEIYRAGRNFFLVDLSVDPKGYEELKEKHLKNASGQGTYELVLTVEDPASLLNPEKCVINPTKFFGDFAGSVSPSDLSAYLTALTHYYETLIEHLKNAHKEVSEIKQKVDES